jgi:hypothetical protein
MPTLRYPYTIGAKIMQFPYRYYFEHAWVFRYWTYSLAVCTPVFWWIQTKARSEGNWKNYYAYREKERKALEHH